MTRSKDITSFTDFRARMRRYLDELKESGRPLFVTTNGEVEAVVIPPGVYDEMARKLELVESLALIERSEKDIAAGRTKPGVEAMREMARELNLKIDR